MKNIIVTLSLITIICAKFNPLLAQSSSGSNVWASNFYLGWTAATGHDLDFGFGNPTYTPYMRLDANSNLGYFGIGTNFSPNFKLDVDAGDINLNTFTNAYRIGDGAMNNSFPVLWHNGDTSSIFVGVHAGNSGIAVAGGVNNTLVGNNAGNSLTSGSYNVCVGTEAGPSINDLLYNTAVGYRSLYGTNSCPLCFDHMSSLNTAIGYEALYSTQAYGGCALGFRAGYSNNDGCSLVAIGENAAGSNTNGNDNNALGEGALYSNTSLSDNVAIGTDALSSQDYNGVTDGSFSSKNVAIGNRALHSNNPNSGSNGIENTAVGFSAGYENVTGAYNSFLGVNSGFNNTGSSNTYLGHKAGYGQSGGASAPTLNTFVGVQAGEDIKTGTDNALVGFDACANIDSGSYNAALGSDAGRYNSGGSKNVFVGYRSGYESFTGNSNTFVGYKAGPNAVLNLNNAAAIGSNATVKNDNQMILGDTSVNVGIGLSGNATGPQNKLEIKTPGTTLHNDGTGSGLMFYNMHNTVTPIDPNPSNGVLSVDASGNVIFVKDGSGAGAIAPDNGLNNTAGPNTVYLGGTLIHSTDISLDVTNGYDLTIDGTTNTSGFMAVGTLSANTGKLNVAGSSALGTSIGNAELAASFESVEPYPVNTGTLVNVNQADAEAIGSAIYVNALGTSADNYGVLCSIGGYAADLSTDYGGYFNNEISPAENSKTINYGVRGNASNANDKNYGTYGEAFNSAGAHCFGASGIAHDGGDCRGVYGKVYSAAHIGYAGYFDAPDTTTIYWAGWFNGKVRVNGPGIINTTWTASDQILKTNIQPVEGASEIISKLKPRSYYFDTTNVYGLRFGSEKQYGLIAQDVQQVLPDMVSETSKPADYDTLGNIIAEPITYKILNYNSLFAIMLQGMQEQQQRIDSLVEVVGNCCHTTGNRSGTQDNSSSSSINVDLKNAQAIILKQNVPNPFAEQTTITYFIPDEIGKAQIIFYDNSGTILKVVDVKEKGNGQLNVFAADLSSGIYTYSLIADGKLIETKKMVCNK